MNFEITGKLIQKQPTQQVSDKFKKREFVLELADQVNGNVYTNYAKFQLVQNKCEVLDRFTEGDNVRVNFNLKGNRWERDGKVNYITNLDAWRIELANQNDTQGAPQAGYNNASDNYNPPPAPPAFNNAPDQADDLPF